MASEKRLAAIQADPIRTMVLARMEELGMNHHELHLRTEQAVSYDTINRWLKGTAGIYSHSLALVLKALGWDGRTKFIPLKSGKAD